MLVAALNGATDQPKRILKQFFRNMIKKTIGLHLLTNVLIVVIFKVKLKKYNNWNKREIRLLLKFGPFVPSL